MTRSLGVVGSDPGSLEPLGDGGWFEPQQMPPLQVRDAPLVDQPANVADTHAQVLGHRLDVEQMRQCLTFVAYHDASSPAPSDEEPS